MSEGGFCPKPGEGGTQLNPCDCFSTGVTTFPGGTNPLFAIDSEPKLAFALFAASTYNSAMWRSAYLIPLLCFGPGPAWGGGEESARDFSLAVQTARTIPVSDRVLAIVVPRIDRLPVDGLDREEVQALCGRVASKAATLVDTDLIHESIAMRLVRDFSPDELRGIAHLGPSGVSGDTRAKWRAAEPLVNELVTNEAERAWGRVSEQLAREVSMLKMARLEQTLQAHREEHGRFPTDLSILLGEGTLRTVGVTNAALLKDGWGRDFSLQVLAEGQSCIISSPGPNLEQEADDLSVSINCLPAFPPLP